MIPSRQPRVPSIGFCSCSARTLAVTRSCRAISASAARRRAARAISSDQVSQVGQELVQRRIEQPDRHRQALHRLEDALEVALLERQQPVERAPGGAPRRAPGSSRCITGSRSSPKNMCSVRQRPMPSAPSSRALAASSGVSAFARTPSRRTSSAQPVSVSKSSFSCGGTSGSAPQDHLAAAAVDRDRVALAYVAPVDRERPRLERRSGAARRPPRTACPSAGDHRRVRGHAAAGGQHALRLDHAVDVVRRRLPAHQDHGLARPCRAPRRCRRRTRRRRPRRPARR